MLSRSANEHVVLWHSVTLVRMIESEKIRRGCQPDSETPYDDSAVRFPAYRDLESRSVPAGSPWWMECPNL